MALPADPARCPGDGRVFRRPVVDDRPSLLLVFLGFWKRRGTADRASGALRANMTDRQKKTEGVALLPAAGGLLLVLGAVGAFTLFQPEPPPEAQKPVKFSVRDAPGIKIEPPSSKTDKIIAFGGGANVG